MTNIHDTILALLAKARDSGVTEAEAAAFASRAARMLAEHNLSEADLRKTRPDQIVRHPYEPRYADPWRRSIVFGAARLYGVRAVNTEKSYTAKSRKTGREKLMHRRSFVFVGPEGSCVVASLMCDYFIETVVKMASTYRRDFETTRAQQLAYERGCGEGLANRLYAAADPQNSRTQTSHKAAETGIMRRGQLSVIDDWMEENLELKKMSTRGSDTSTPDAWVGAAASDSIGLDTQANTDGSTIRRLS